MTFETKNGERRTGSTKESWNTDNCVELRLDPETFNDESFPLIVPQAIDGTRGCRSYLLLPANCPLVRVL